MEHFRERVAHLEESLCCPNCSQFFVEPLILDCGHVICNRCITVDAYGSRSCVLCRRVSETVKPNYPLQRAVELLLGHEGEMLWILRNGGRSAAPDYEAPPPGSAHSPEYIEPPPPGYNMSESTRRPPGPPSRYPEETHQRQHPPSGPPSAPHYAAEGGAASQRTGEMPPFSPPRRAAARPDPWAEGQGAPRSGPPPTGPPSYHLEREREWEGASPSSYASPPYYETRQHPDHFPPASRSGLSPTTSSFPPPHVPPIAAAEERSRYAAAHPGGAGGGDGDDEIELFGRRARRAVHVAAIPREQGPEGCNLFVCRLPEWADELDLYYAVRHMPGLVGLTIVRHDNGVSKNLAYLSYMRHRDAYNAILALHGLVMAPTIAYPPRVRETGRMRAIKVDVKRVEQHALQRHLTAEQAASINLQGNGNMVEGGGGQLDVENTPSPDGSGNTAGGEGGAGTGEPPVSRLQRSVEAHHHYQQQEAAGMGERGAAERDLGPVPSSSPSSLPPHTISGGAGLGDLSTEAGGGAEQSSSFGPPHVQSIGEHEPQHQEAAGGDGHELSVEAATGWPASS